MPLPSSPVVLLIPALGQRNRDAGGDGQPADRSIVRSLAASAGIALLRSEPQHTPAIRGGFIPTDPAVLRTDTAVAPLPGPAPLLTPTSSGAWKGRAIHEGTASCSQRAVVSFSGAHAGVAPAVSSRAARSWTPDRQERQTRLCTIANPDNSAARLATGRRAALLTVDVTAIPTLTVVRMERHDATPERTLVLEMGTPPKLHLRLMDGMERVQNTFDSVVAPDSDGGISITPRELLLVNAEFQEVLPLVAEAADTLRLINTAAGTGVSSAWLAKRMDEQINDLKVINLDRYRTAKETGRLIVLEDHRDQGIGPSAA
jgi:hypothetical protein